MTAPPLTPELRPAEGCEDPAILLEYQSRAIDRIVEPAANDNKIGLLATTALPLILVIEKSRRIGITWAVGLAAVLTAGSARGEGGQHVYYMGYNLEMARDFIECCARWARAVDAAAGEIGEAVFDDEGKDVKAFRIDFASGFSIIALPSSPRVLRGRQGLVIIDEAAFHDDLAELMKAVIALTMWGGRVILISTHNGEDNPFNALIGDIRAGKRSGEVLKVTLEDALEDGLYKRICDIRGLDWSQDAQNDWEEELRRAYGEDAAEELDAIPARGGGAVLPRALVKARMTDDFSVARITLPDNFTSFDRDRQRGMIARILAEEVDLHLAALDPELKHYFGLDFGRTIDLSVMPIGREARNLTLEVPLTIEMRNVPFREQEEIVAHVISHLPRFMAGKMDARGNGQALAEEMQRRFGKYRIEAVMLSDAWYLQHMPHFVARFSDANILLAADDLLVDDLALLKRIRGVIKLDQTRTGSAGARRHGDFAIACALLNAAGDADVMPVEGFPVGQPRPAAAAFGDAPARAAIRRDVGFGIVGGGLDFGGF